MKNVELLAPVGKMENAIAAIENGANALFVGGKCFNARQYADNFNENELEEIVTYAKLRGVCVYVTVNILIKEQEVEALYDYLKELERIGVHAVITQDLGVARLVRDYFPNLRLHASTQMSAHSLEDVLFLKSQGFKRVVLARELNLREIQAITKTCDIEIETFIHGALCYSYSGQCLMSSLIGGRSGNRGRCAQPCRMKYQLASEEGKILTEESYLLSLKDICSVEFLPQLVAAGITSFKIEGRMKSPEYVASVVGTYRKYLNLALDGQTYEVSQEDMDVLKGVFNRGGFSKGYYFEHGTKQMLTPVSPKHIGLKAGQVTHFAPKTKTATILLERELHPGDGLEIIRKGRESVGTGVSKDYAKGSLFKCQFEHFVEVGSEAYLTKNHQLLKSLRSTYQKAHRKLPLHMVIEGKLGEPLFLQLTCEGKQITYTGDVLEPAQKAPLTKEGALKQLGKLGSTSFILDVSEMIWDEGVYLPISRLNEMRREAVALLEKALLEVPPSVAPEHLPIKETSYDGEQMWRARVMNEEQLDVLLQRTEITGIYWEWQYNDEKANSALQKCLKKGVDFYLALPAIMKDKAYSKYEKILTNWTKEPITGFLVRTYGEYEMLKDYHKVIVTDYNMNVMNNVAIGAWESLGVDTVTVSVELTSEELAPLKGNLEKVIYGHIPVMTSQQCILRHTSNCQKGQAVKAHYEIKDRKDVTWGIGTDCEACTMQLFSHDPLMIKKYEIEKLQGFKSYRLQLNGETAAEVEMILEAYLDGKELKSLKWKGITFKEVL